tara:strand:- start:14703 stop:15134 length:432 start_codon:yes stop_codon:yes gene_type:complete
MHHMIRRQRAAQAAIDTFLGKPLRWGGADCVRLARFHLHKLGVSVPLLQGVRYRSEARAKVELAALGFETLLEAVDATGFTRIAPAMAWCGDIIALPTPPDAPFDIALNIAVGNGRLLGLHQGQFSILQPAQFVAAWRVPVHG